MGATPITDRQPTLLVIRLRQLGDVLATLGTLRALKEASPQRRIAFVVDRKYHALLEPVEFIDMLLPEPPRFDSIHGALEYCRYVRSLWNLAPECVLDFHSNLRSAILAYLSRAPARIGFDVRIRKRLYTEVESRRTKRNGSGLPRTSHQSAMALGRRCGAMGGEGSVRRTIPVTASALETERSALVRCGVAGENMDARNVVGINPGNPYPAKAWSEASFAEICRRFVAAERSVVIFWGPGERERAERIALASGPGVHVAPPFTLERLPGAIGNLSVLVTIDSGLKHLAVAVGVPTVTLFGPTNPHEWHMGSDRDVVLYAGLSCSPCRLLECPFGSPCMDRLTPDAVMRCVASIEASAVET